MYYSKNRHIYTVYIGTLSTITAKFPKISIVFFETDNDFIKYIQSLYKKLNEDGRKERPSPIMRRPTSLKHRKENCLTAAKGVGVPMSKKLIKKYGSVNAVANATEDDLVTIDKLGKQTAKNILEMLN
jgi:ERCC4-type nuclease